MHYTGKLLDFWPKYIPKIYCRISGRHHASINLVHPRPYRGAPGTRVGMSPCSGDKTEIIHRLAREQG
jgi:hypothetical protein